MLSVAMIVKNEAHNLERCLKSLMPLNAELVIVDTGSTDNTIEIAKRYTNKVYQEPWREDFGWHRNHSFGLCTQDWILGIDADEELIFDQNSTPQAMLKDIANLPENIHVVGMTVKDWREHKKDHVAEFDSLRFFRKGKVKWTRRIHNKPNFEGDAAVVRNVYIRHYGYDITDEGRKAKARRTIGMLKKTLEENPTDYESMFYIAQAYAAFLSDKDNAVKWSERYIKYKEELGNDFNPSIYHLAAAIYGSKGMEEKCDEWISMGLERDPDDLDLLYDLLQYGLRHQNPDIIGMASARFVAAFDNFPAYRDTHPGRFFFHSDTISLSLALFYQGLGLIESGTAHYRRLLQLIPQLPNEKAKQEITAKLGAFMQKMGYRDTQTRYNNTPPPSAPPKNRAIVVNGVQQNLELPAL